VLVLASFGAPLAQMPVPRPPAAPPAVPGLPAARPAALPAAVPEETVPGLKFKNSPLEMVLKDYAEKTHRTILQAAQGLPNPNITLESQTNLTQEEYLEAEETVLAMNGVGVLKVGEKFLKVVPIASARTEAMEITEKEETPLKESDALISQMIPLKNIDLNEAVNAITPLKHPYGNIHKLERSNSILITDSAATINRINQIIKYIDLPIEALEEPNIIEIRYAKASEIKKKLEEIIADAKKDAMKASVPQLKTTGAPGVVRPTVPTPPGVIRATTPTPAATELTQLMEQVERGIIRGEVKIIADDRTNILIIITRKENMAFFKLIIKALDVETAPDVIVKVVRLEYAEAEQVAATLNTLIGQVSKGPDAKTTPVAGGDQKGESAALREYVDRLQKERDAAAVAVKGAEKSKVGELSADNIKILPDKRTNSLLIMASKGDLATLEEMIKGMDIMLSQVMIEVVIFKITLLNSYERGIDWVQRAMVAYDKGSGGGKPSVGFAGVGGGDKYRASMKDPLGLTTLPSLSSTAGNLTYYATFFDLNLDAIIKLIASDNRTQIVSSPTILTTDNKKATIDVTTEKYFFKGLKFVSTSGSGAGEWVDDVEMKKVGTKLTVTPRINEKKNVVMEIDQNLEEEGGSQKITGAGGASDWPTIDASQMTASVAVRSGETIVLGGLVSNSKVANKSKVPLLGSIPLIGGLFSYKKDENTRNEVVVFITPYVLDTPEEMEAKVQRRKGAMNMAAADWPASSDSKLAQKPQEVKPAKGNKEKEKVKEKPAPKAPVASEPAVTSFPTDMDPELVEFIKRQDKKYGKALDKMDNAVDKEIRESEPQE